MSSRVVKMELLVTILEVEGQLCNPLLVKSRDIFQGRR